MGKEGIHSVGMGRRVPLFAATLWAGFNPRLWNAPVGRVGGVLDKNAIVLSFPPVLLTRGEQFYTTNWLACSRPEIRFANDLKICFGLRMCSGSGPAPKNSG